MKQVSDTVFEIEINNDTVQFDTNDYTQYQVEQMMKKLGIQSVDGVVEYAQVIEKNFKAYLRGKELEMQKKLKDNRLEISCEEACTSFSHRNRQSLHSQKEFLALAKEIRKVAKEKQVRLKGLNKLTGKVKDDELYSQYEKEVLDYNSKFDQLSHKWSTWNLHKGFSADIYYKNKLEPLEFALQKYRYRNTKISQFNDMYYRLSQVLNILKSQQNYSFITF